MTVIIGQAIILRKAMSCSYIYYLIKRVIFNTIGSGKGRGVGHHTSRV